MRHHTYPQVDYNLVAETCVWERIIKFMKKQFSTSMYWRRNGYSKQKGNSAGKDSEINLGGEFELRLEWRAGKHRWVEKWRSKHANKGRKVWKTRRCLNSFENVELRIYEDYTGRWGWWNGKMNPDQGKHQTWRNKSVRQGSSN